MALVARADQRVVYILSSTVYPGRYYTGLTSDVHARLSAHNAGSSKHTASGRPWRLVATIEFSDAARAEAFEEYLKSGSGRAFARRHFR
jgi:predicted GIY-YIG superfamily endonuclease